jgi:hypothetical protein
LKRAWLAVMSIVTIVSSEMMDASAATPVPFPATPTPQACQVDPVALGYLSGLLGTPAAAIPGAEVELQGLPAGRDVIQEIEPVIFEVFACFNAGEPLRAYSHYSDAYLRRILAGETPESLSLLATPYPLDQHEWTAIIDIRDIRMLDNGRAYATVILDPGLIPIQKIFGFFLIQHNNRWLIDDVLDELEFSLP